MKRLIIVIIGLSPFFLFSQSRYFTAGAQCGAHGSGGCEHFRTTCPPDTDAEIWFVLHTDDQGQETGYQLFDVTDNVVVLSGSNLLSAITYDIRQCVYSGHCYRLTLSDAAGNGLNPAKGWFRLYFNAEKIAEGGVFTDSIVFELGACCSTLEVSLSGGFACYDIASGQVVATVEGGVPPYAYAWSTGASHATMQNVSPDDNLISVIVTDAAGCVASDELSVQAIGSFELTTEVTAPSVKDASDGTASAITTGGIQPYTYLWSTGAVTATASDLPAGQYSVTVFDASGCSGTALATVPEGSSATNETALPLEGLTLFPNPTTGNVTAVFNAREDSPGLVQVFDATGQLRHTLHFRATTGKNQLTLDLKQMPHGACLVYIRAGNAAGSRWVVVAD